MADQAAAFEIKRGDGYPVVPMDETTTRRIEEWVKKTVAVKDPDAMTRTANPDADLDACMVQGKMGEYAVARALGLDPDFAVTRKADPGYDLVFEGKRIQVKTTATRAGHLALPAYEDALPPNVDAAVLAVLLRRGHAFAEPERVESVRVAGCISRDRFSRVARRKAFRDGAAPQLCVDQSALAPIQKMVESFRKGKK